MSQKAEAYEAYISLQESYNANTCDDWNVLTTISGGSLIDTELPADSVREILGDGCTELIESYTDSLTERAMQISYPMFVRACPLSPRPGVLESSAVYNKDELRTTIKRIATTMLSIDTATVPMYEHGYIDPQGTIIVQPYINATASAVVAPNNYIIMGRDNDGITAGKDGLRVAIPLGNDPYVRSDLRKLDIDEDKVEIEFVSELNSSSVRKASRTSQSYSHRHAMVQLRGSEGARELVPAPAGVTINGTLHGAESVVVTDVHVVSDNSDEQLDKMEAYLRSNPPAGSVVAHPNGTHLSHHAGQCFKYGVPYIASGDVSVGDTWVQAAAGWVIDDANYEAQPYNPLAYIDEFISGFNVGYTNFGRQHGWLSTVFHQFLGGALIEPAQTAHLAGAYVGWLINATLSVGLGEVRHSVTQAQQTTALPHAIIYGAYGHEAWNAHEDYSYENRERKHYYLTIENNPVTLATTQALFTLAEKVYSASWSGGYGGKKYKESCANGRLLAEAMQRLIDNPTDENFQEMVGHANTTEHNVHNNGFFFNKFMTKTALDWGTDPSSVRIHPRHFFCVYYAAQDIINSTPNDMLDSSDFINQSLNITQSSMRDTPLGTRPEFKSAINNMHHLQRHPNNSKFSNYTSLTSYIPCGADDCQGCDMYYNELSLSISTGLQPIVETYEADFPQQPKAYSMELKSLSHLANKNIEAFHETMDNDKSLLDFFTLMQQNNDTANAKYISNIVASLTPSQLIQLGKLNKGDN